MQHFVPNSITPPKPDQLTASEPPSPPSSARSRPLQLREASTGKQDSWREHSAADSPRKRLAGVLDPSQTVYAKIPSTSKKQKLLLPHQKDVLVRQRRGECLTALSETVIHHSALRWHRCYALWVDLKALHEHRSCACVCLFPVHLPCSASRALSKLPQLCYNLCKVHGGRAHNGRLLSCCMTI